MSVSEETIKRIDNDIQFAKIGEIVTKINETIEDVKTLYGCEEYQVDALAAVARLENAKEALARFSKQFEE